MAGVFNQNRLMGPKDDSLKDAITAEKGDGVLEQSRATFKNNDRVSRRPYLKKGGQNVKFADLNSIQYYSSSAEVSSTRSYLREDVVKMKERSPERMSRYRRKKKLKRLWKKLNRKVDMLSGLNLEPGEIPNFSFDSTDCLRINDPETRHQQLNTKDNGLKSETRDADGRSPKDTGQEPWRDTCASDLKYHVSISTRITSLMALDSLSDQCVQPSLSVTQCSEEFASRQLTLFSVDVEDPIRLLPMAAINPEPSSYFSTSVHVQQEERKMFSIQMNCPVTSTEPRPSETIGMGVSDYAKTVSSRVLLKQEIRGSEAQLPRRKQKRQPVPPSRQAQLQLTESCVADADNHHCDCPYLSRASVNQRPESDHSCLENLERYLHELAKNGEVTEGSCSSANEERGNRMGINMINSQSEHQTRESTKPNRGKVQATGRRHGNISKDGSITREAVRRRINAREGTASYITENEGITKNGTKSRHVTVGGAISRENIRNRFKAREYVTSGKKDDVKAVRKVARMLNKGKDPRPADTGKMREINTNAQGRVDESERIVDYVTTQTAPKRPTGKVRRLLSIFRDKIRGLGRSLRQYTSCGAVF